MPINVTRHGVLLTSSTDRGTATQHQYETQPAELRLFMIAAIKVWCQAVGGLELVQLTSVWKLESHYANVGDYGRRGKDRRKTQSGTARWRGEMVRKERSLEPYRFAGL